MLQAFLPHVPEEYRLMTEQAILEREFELMYIEGRTKSSGRALTARFSAARAAATR